MASAWAIGMRISGAPSPAVTPPSRQATRPCTIDLRVHHDVEPRRLDSEKVMRLDQLEALVHQRG